MFTVTHRPGATWSQADLGEDFDLLALTVIGGMDPDGERGVVEGVLRDFLDSLEPALTSMERFRAARWPDGVLAEARKLGETAAQVGAVRLADACLTAAGNFHVGARTGAVFANATLNVIVDDLIAEIVRTQRKLRRLLDVR